MIIQLEISEENESTDSPYWMIINPRQSMRADFQEIASMITGPFFSRESAQTHLDNRRYAFGKRAVVYCFSGYWSQQYKDACKKARAIGEKE